MVFSFKISTLSNRRNFQSALMALGISGPGSVKFGGGCGHDWLSMYHWLMVALKVTLRASGKQVRWGQFFIIWGQPPVPTTTHYLRPPLVCLSLSPLHRFACDLFLQDNLMTGQQGMPAKSTQGGVVPS